MVLLSFVTYEIYHLISKLRGNEKNVHMNNYGAALVVLGGLYYLVWFIDTVSIVVADDKSTKWVDHHRTFYNWIYWSAESAYLL